MKKILPLFFLMFVIGFTKPALAVDPHFILNPSSGTKSGSFDTEIRIDSAGQALGGADVYLSYPKNLLKVDSFTKPGDAETSKAFTEVYSLIKNDEGKMRIFGYFPSAEAGKSFTGSNGLLGTINFSVLSTGTAAVSFICTAGQTNDTNLTSKTDTKDIVVCSANVNSSFTLGGGGATSTPTPSSTLRASPTATPTTPVSGAVEDTLFLLGFGFIFILTGVGLSINVVRNKNGW